MSTDPTMTTSTTAYSCPACERTMSARVTYSVALGNIDIDAREVSAKVRPVGFQISHDCTPKATR